MVGASARYSCLHTPVETGTPPRRSKLHIAFRSSASGERSLRCFDSFPIRLFLFQIRCANLPVIDRRIVMCGCGCRLVLLCTMCAFFRSPCGGEAAGRWLQDFSSEAQPRRSASLPYHYTRFLSDMHDKIMNDSKKGTIIPLRVRGKLHRRFQR